MINYIIFSYCLMFFVCIYYYYTDANDSFKACVFFWLASPLTMPWTIFLTTLKVFR